MEVPPAESFSCALQELVSAYHKDHQTPKDNKDPKEHLTSFLAAVQQQNKTTLSAILRHSNLQTCAALAEFVLCHAAQDILMRLVLLLDFSWPSFLPLQWTLTTVKKVLMLYFLMLLPFCTHSALL